MTGAMAEEFNDKGGGAYDLKYTVNDDNTSVTCTGMVNKDDAGAADLVIPDSVSNGGIDYSVTSIGHWAFANCSGFTGSLTIPNSVTSIGVQAFFGCGGFDGSLTIPNSVTSIGYEAFWDCDDLADIICLSTTPPTVYNSFGYNMNHLPITVPWGCQAAYKTAEGWSGFHNYQNHTTNYQVPNSYMLEYGFVEENNVFECNGLSEGEEAGAADLIIPDSIEHNGTKYAVISIVRNAFGDDENSSYYGDPSDLNKDTGFTGSLTIGNNIESIESEAFSGCSGFTGSLTIPNSVTSIVSNAFYECSGFDGTLTIGSGLTDIDYTFDNLRFSEIKVNSANTAYSSIDGILYNKAQDELLLCPGGKVGDVVVANKVKLIADEAFYGCRNIGSITLGTGIEYIEEYAFSGCKFNELTVLCSTPPTMELDYEVPTFDFDALNARGIKVYVPCGSVEDYSTAFGWEMFNHIYEIRPYKFEAISDNTIKGDVEIVSSSDYAAEDYTITFRAVPTRGYMFIRWNDGVEDAERTISLTQDTTIIANFEVAYTITYDANGGEGVMKSQNVAIGRRHALATNTYTKSDASFVGWATTRNGEAIYTDAEEVISIGAAEEEVKLYAVWKSDTGVKDVTAAAPFTRVQNTLYFAQPTAVAVYNVSGVMLHSGEVMEYTLPNAAGVYIIRTANSCVKVMK